MPTMLLSPASWSQKSDEVTIENDQHLVRIFRQSSYQLDKIQSDYLNSEQQELNNLRSYTPQLGLNFSKKSTNRDKLYTDEFVLQDTQVAGLSLKKRISLGGQIEIGLQQTRIESSGYEIYAPQTYIQTNLSLWNNLFGKLDRSQLSALKKQSEIQKIRTQMDQHQIEITLQNLYWNIVGLDMIIDLTRGLVKSADEQLKSTQNLAQSSVADKSDVARALSLKSQRQAALASALRTRENIEQKISLLIPEMANKHLNFAPVDVGARRAQVRECIASISRQNEVPLKWSQYYKMTQLLDQLQPDLIQLNDFDRKFDIQLQSKYSGIAYDQNSSTAFSNSTQFDSNEFFAGVSINIPLGSNESKYLDSKNLQVKKQINFQRQQILANMKSTHHSTIVVHENYRSEVLSLEEAIKQLKTRMIAVNKKYHQGRVSYIDLIREEETLQNLEINLIQKKVDFLINLLNYISIFDQTQCEFNLKVAQNG